MSAGAPKQRKTIVSASTAPLPRENRLPQLGGEGLVFWDSFSEKVKIAVDPSEDTVIVWVLKQTTPANNMRVTVKKNYRVVSGDSVLNYYSTRDQAKSYLLDLKKHSPKVWADARVQKLK